MKAIRAAYIEEVSQLPPDKLVFIDEAGINTSMARRYGWAKSSRIYSRKPAQRGRNVTLIGALRRTGIIAAMTIDGSAGGDVFLTFIKEVLAPKLNPGDIVILDNVSTHKVKGVAEAIHAVGARLLYLPPYSPELNPIEECWSKLKGLLRSAAARTRATLDEAVRDALAAITGINAQGWFRHAGYV